MSNARRIVKHLEGDWRGDFGLVPGPGHSPKDRSLSVRDSADGQDVIFHSFAGEDWRPIKDRLRAEGMLPEMTRGSTSTASPPTVYTYRDQDGAPVFRIVRKHDKRFVAQHPNGPDLWKAGMGGRTPVPYRLPEILAAHPDETIFVVEGEKDADNLAALGCNTTTSPFGAGNWHTACSPHLAGREVVILPDNDDAGRAHARDVAAKLAGHARSITTLALPGLREKGDVSDWIAAGGTLAALHGLVRDTPEAEPDSDGQCGLGSLAIINPAEWEGVDVPQREWLIDGWLASGTAALLAGADGVGKSLLSQQLATCLATGTPFLGMPTRETRAIYITAEDDADELHRRQSAINASIGVTMAGAGPRLGLLSLKGEDCNLLATYDAEGRMYATSLFYRIEVAAKAHGAGFVVLDNIAHLFGGNENVRSQVAAFCNLMDRLAIAIGGTVLFLGHPAKAEGSEYSGSTGWSAHVRQRLFVERLKANDEIIEPDARTLRKSKANYAQAGEEISFVWHRGAFTIPGAIPAGMRYGGEAENAGRANEIFLACLAAATKQRRNASHSPNARNYAPKAFARMPEGRGLKAQALARAMEGLFALGEITAAAELWRGSDRKFVLGLKLAEPPQHGLEECGTVRDGLSKRAENRAGESVAGECGAVAESDGKPCGKVRDGESVYNIYGAAPSGSRHYAKRKGKSGKQSCPASRITPRPGPSRCGTFQTCRTRRIR